MVIARVAAIKRPTRPAGSILEIRARITPSLFEATTDGSMSIAAVRPKKITSPASRVQKVKPSMLPLTAVFSSLAVINLVRWFTSQQAANTPLRR